MLLNRYIQQPSENLKRVVDYERWLESDEQIVNVAASVSPVTDPPLAITNILVDDAAKEFGFYAGGGVALTDYTVTFQMQTNIGQLKEDEIEYWIEES